VELAAMARRRRGAVEKYKEQTHVLPSWIEIERGGLFLVF